MMDAAVSHASADRAIISAPTHPTMSVLQSSYWDTSLSVTPCLLCVYGVLMTSTLDPLFRRTLPPHVFSGQPRDTISTCRSRTRTCSYVTAYVCNEIKQG